MAIIFPELVAQILGKYKSFGVVLFAVKQPNEIKKKGRSLSQLQERVVGLRMPVERIFMEARTWSRWSISMGVEEDRAAASRALSGSMLSSQTYHASK
jgi:hypothetical protein